MKLIFIRHGQATAYCADDAGRNLTEFGQAQAQETAEQLLSKYSPNLIIASPFNRANQTAQILSNLANAQNKPHHFITLDTITPDDDPEKGVDDITALVNPQEHECVVVVCHMPIVAHMTALLDGQVPVSFELAEYRVLDISVIAQGLGTQVDAFSPAQP